MNDQDETTPDRPLGFWLHTTDRVISARIAEALADEGVDRRDWMLLNLLSGDVQDPERLARFVHRGRRLSALHARGWAEWADGTWTLTTEGRAVKDRLAEKVAGVRAQVADAVSPEDFATMMASLQAISRSLGGDDVADAARVLRRRRHGGKGRGGNHEGCRHGHEGCHHGHGEHGCGRGHGGHGRAFAGHHGHGHGRPFPGHRGRHGYGADERSATADVD
ncbi:hypothetical protein F6J84_14720 [Microbacterium caowuchunii]|uniref:MarR family winged helix-turn-helix transcriptional regulator n=1 Tax=Microbacterium caowuchunii TaxID=2614638 RepID=UPI001247E114|nr:hypothetical protein [Microbacterium caowuchunii]QEW01225.1 hypothetical protein F6J84_14720 [Microbacterium caowuchunii]